MPTGKHVLIDPFVSLAGTDLSDHVQSVTLNYSADTPEGTASGDDTHVMIPGGLKNYSIEFTFYQDYDAGSVEETLFSNIGQSVAFEVRPSQAAVASTNPSYTGNCIPESMPLVDADVTGGNAHQTSVTCQAASSLSRATV